MIKYNKLFDLMANKGYTAAVVKKKNLIPQGTYYKMKNGEGTVTIETINKICELLDCQPSDLIEYVPAKDNNTK